MGYDRRIAIYGCGADAKTFSDFIEKRQMGKIICYIQTQKILDSFMGCPVITIADLSWDEIDDLVIASSKYYDEILSVLKENMPSCYREKVVYMLDFVERLKVKDDIYSVCTVKGNLSFMFSNTDTIIGPYMWFCGITDGAQKMEFLFSFLKEKKMFSGNGVFLDIGANIGTASIYAKYLEKELSVISFEPSEENYRILKINSIINNMDDIAIEKIGLGEMEKEVCFEYHPENPGGSRVLSDENAEQTKVSIESLDGYLLKKEIDYQNISFIWMDVEGYECDVILGSRKTLLSHKIPLVHEFNFREYDKCKFEKYIEIMKECYEFFIDVRKAMLGDLVEYPISYLKEYAKGNKEQTDLLFI